jgi:hypothetical protein
MRRAVVGYPKNSVRRPIWFLAHDKIDQLVETINTSAGLAQTKDFGLSYIPCRHISQRPHSFIFKLNTTIASNRWSCYPFQSTPGLNTGFFIGRNNKIIAAQGFSFPDPVVQIKDSRGFLFEIRITGPNPTAVTPWANGIFAQPAPDCFSTDRGYNPLFFRLPGDFIVSEFGKWKSEVLGQLAGKRLHGYNDFRGKKRRVSLAVAFPVGQPCAGQRSVYAT